MSPVSRRILGWALWVWLFTFTFLGLDHAIGDGDECVHASALREMMRAGDYLHLRYQGILTLERPLLPYWLAAPFAALVRGEVGFRISSAIASFATLVCVFAGARSTWKRSDAAFLAVLLLAGSPSFHSYSRTLMSDPPLVFSLSLAIVGALRMLKDPGALRLVAAGAGLGIACKSLIVAIPILALSPWVLFVFVRRADGATRLAACGWFAITALPYYALGFALHGKQFGYEHFYMSLARRAVDSGGIGMHGDRLVFLRWIAEAEGPFTATWLALGSVGALAFGIYRRRADLALLGSFALLLVAMMSSVALRLPHYILPAYPAAALGVAGLYASLMDRPAFDERSAIVLLGPALGLLVLSASSIYPGGNTFLYQTEAGKELGAIARRATRPDQTLYTYDWYGPSLKFYAERPLVLLTTHEGAYALLKVFVVAIADGVERVPPAPAPVGTEIVIAGDERTLRAVPWLQVQNVLGFSDPWHLLRARVVDAPPGPSHPRP